MFCPYTPLTLARPCHIISIVINRKLTISMQSAATGLPLRGGCSGVFRQRARRGKREENDIADYCKGKPATAGFLSLA